MLANIERLEMQAEGAHGEQHGVEKQLGEALSVVSGERFAQQQQVFEQGHLRFVVRQRCGGCERKVAMHCGWWHAAETQRNTGKLQANRLRREAVREGCGVARGTELREVGVEAITQRGRDGRLPGRHGELLEQILQLRKVVVVEQLARHGEGLGGGLGCHERVSVAIATNPGAEADHDRKRRQLGRCGGCIFCVQGARNFRVENGDGLEERGLEIVQRHADFIVHGGPGMANVIGLPERRNLGEERCLQSIQLQRGHGNRIQPDEQVGDAAALEHDAAARHLGWMRSEHGRDADAAKQCQRLFPRNTRCAKATQGAAEAAALRHGRSMEQRRAPPTLAVICLGEIDEFEIKREGTRQEKRGARVGGDLVGDLLRLMQMHKPGSEIAPCVGLTACDCGAAQILHRIKDGTTGLLAQDLSEQRAQRTNVAAQRCFLALTRAGFKFCKSIRPTGRCPKRGHS